MKRLVVVADNPLIVAAIRNGVRTSSTLELIGYVEPREATAARVVEAGANVVLVDEAEGSELTISLIRSLKEHTEDIHVIALTLSLDSAWLERALEAGANGAISKSVHPAALAILVREIVSGHIVHAASRLRSSRSIAPTPAPADSHSSLTEREREILRLVASGATNSGIARQLWITQQTVKFHVSNIYRKLDVTNRTEACHYAHVNGLASSRAAAAVEHDEVLALAC